jgi:FkbM family methyltransferase
MAEDNARVRNSDRGHWLKRYVFRKDVLTRIRRRAARLERTVTRDPIRDAVALLSGGVRTVVDAGANIGYVAEQLHQAFPGAHVYCFEPTPDTFATLSTRLGGRPAFTLHQLAVSDQVGTATFNITRNSSVSSLLEHSAYNRAHWAAKPLPPITVRTTTLDTFMGEQKLSEIDLLKLDVEGAEVMALKGAKAALAGSKISAIMLEAMLQPMYRGQPLLWDVVAHLREHDYQLYNIYEISESTIRQALFCNALFLSPRLRERLVEQHGRDACGW